MYSTVWNRYIHKYKHMLVLSIFLGSGWIGHSPDSDVLGSYNKHTVRERPPTPVNGP